MRLLNCYTYYYAKLAARRRNLAAKIPGLNKTERVEGPSVFRSESFIMSGENQRVSYFIIAQRN